MNKYTGVLGVYNCQGAAWNTIEKKNTFHETNSDPITAFVRGRDVHLIKEAATDPDWSGDCVAYSNHSNNLVILSYNAAITVSLKVLEHDIFTITPIKTFPNGFSFAPLGLIYMYNSGAAIEGLTYKAGLSGSVRVEVKGCGKFGAYSSVKPKRCVTGSDQVDFGYNSSSGLLTLNLSNMPKDGHRVHVIEIEL